MIDLFISTLIFMFPIYLIIGILIIRLIFIKVISPVLGFTGGQISKRFGLVKKCPAHSGNHIVYELPNSIKIMAIFIICYTTYCLFNRESTYNGFFESYAFFAISWAFFFFQIYKIELIDDRYLIFHRVLKKTKFEVKDITHDFDGIRYYRLYYENGSVWIDHMIQGIESFRNKIKALKPDMNHEELSANNLHKDLWGFQFALHYIVFGVGLIVLIIFVCIKIISNFTNTWT